MQVLISLPPVEDFESVAHWERAISRKICGVPLLQRVILTALRNGGTSVLLLHPNVVSGSWLSSQLTSPRMPVSQIETISVDSTLNSTSSANWLLLGGRLKHTFLWLPWNFVTDRKTLSRIIEAGTHSTKGIRFGVDLCARLPMVIIKEKLERLIAAEGSSAKLTNWMQRYAIDGELDLISADNFTGIAVISNKAAQEAEVQLVRRSGKDSDGMNSKFNRWMVRPVVRWLSNTPISPNSVTFTGLAASALAGYCFAQGFWTAYIAGALLYFGGVLCDEIDGMLARVTFRESPFGCWLETYVDYAGYLLIFTGMTVGLYAEYRLHSIVEGALLVFGTLMSFSLLLRQRKMATDPKRPQDYRMHLYRKLDDNSGNLASLLGRAFEPLMRNGAFCYVVLIFSALNWVHALFLSIAIGSNVVWVVVLYYNRFFPGPQVERQTWPVTIAK